MNKFLAFLPMFAAALMVLASGMMLESVHELRSVLAPVLRMDSELERLAIGYLRQQEELREEARKGAVITLTRDPLAEKAMDAIHNAPINLDLSPKTSPNVKPKK